MLEVVRIKPIHFMIPPLGTPTASQCKSGTIPELDPIPRGGVKWGNLSFLNNEVDFPLESYSSCDRSQIFGFVLFFSFSPLLLFNVRVKAQLLALMGWGRLWWSLSRMERCVSPMVQLQTVGHKSWEKSNCCIFFCIFATNRKTGYVVFGKYLFIIWVHVE